MGISKTLLSILLLSLFLLHLVQAHQSVHGHHGYGSGRTINCGAACKGRCQLASRHTMCLRACGTCCRRCSCVPPGTSGNRDVCPCYATMTTHGGRRKCP